MRLSTISEDNLQSMLNRYNRDTFLKLEKILDAIPRMEEDRKKHIYNEMRQAIIRSDLTEDQRYWERLANLMGVPATPGSPFRKSLQVALETIKQQKIEDTDEEKNEEETEQQDTDQSNSGGGLLSGLKAAFSLYLQVYARQHGLSMPGGDDKISQNIKLLEVFFKEFTKFIK